MIVKIIDSSEKLLMEEDTPVRFPEKGDSIVIDDVAYSIHSRVWVYSSREGNNFLLCVAVFEGTI